MLSFLINNLHVRLYSGAIIGVINRLGSVIDFNASSTLLIKSASTICWTDQMGRKPCRCSRRSASKTSAESNNPLSESGGYEAPTVGYEDILYSHSTTKVTALFGTVSTKFTRYVSVQIWSGATIVGKAMEKLVGPTLTKPTLPLLTKEYEVFED